MVVGLAWLKIENKDICPCKAAFGDSCGIFLFVIRVGFLQNQIKAVTEELDLSWPFTRATVFQPCQLTTAAAAFHEARWNPSHWMFPLPATFVCWAVKWSWQMVQAFNFFFFFLAQGLQLQPCLHPILPHAKSPRLDPCPNQFNFRCLWEL